MKTALALATGLMALSSTASAGTYLGLALGTQPGVNDELGSVAAPDGRSARFLGGFRFGNLSIEGAVNGFGVLTSRGEQTVYQLSAAGKFNLPLGDGFEALGRAGLERTSLDVGDDRYNLAGNGFLVGAGFEYRLNLGVTSASIFVDYTIHHATLEDGRHEQVGATSRIWALGFTVGI
jgi:Outer membrane protein beta-barrel domain